MTDLVSTLEEILRRYGTAEVNLRENEVDRYFLFDQISDPADLEKVWSLFPEHRVIRARADEVDACSDIVPGWGYRTPRTSNLCSDAELTQLVREHLTVTRTFLTDDWEDIGEFIDNGYEIELLNAGTAEIPDPMDNKLFMGIYESLGDFRIQHYPYGNLLAAILSDWAIYLTKCDEVALYLLWPLLQDVEDCDPNTPIPGFRLWQYNCRTKFWIKEGNLESGVVIVQRPEASKSV